MGGGGGQQHRTTTIPRGGGGGGQRVGGKRTHLESEFVPQTLMASNPPATLSKAHLPLEAKNKTAPLESEHFH